MRRRSRMEKPLRESRSFHSHEEDTRRGHDRYVKRIDDDMRYGNAREQDYINNRAHNIPNNRNMEHNPGGGAYSNEYYTGRKGGPGRFDQFNDEYDDFGAQRMSQRDQDEWSNRDEDYLDLYNMRRFQRRRK